MRRSRWLDAREVHRWLTLRCGHCGHRFRWKRDDRHKFNPSGPVYHGACMTTLLWKRAAEDRLTVLALVVDVTNVTVRDVQAVAELRAEDAPARAEASNRAWRVFYDLDIAARVAARVKGP